jgi:serine/threonine-protein kinase RsbT
LDIRSIKNTLEASIIEGESRLDNEITHVYASDLMSDVLAFGLPESILITGLASRQAVISAHMAEFKGVVFIRGKKPKDGSEQFARDNKMVLLSSKMDMFDACVRINAAKNIKTKNPAPLDEKHEINKMLLSQEFMIEGSDFASAGMVSTSIKSILKKIGFDPLFVRRIAISTYEAEMNVVMHAKRAKVFLNVSPTIVEVILDDEGKGIPDIDKAMQSGFTTATEEMRALGFGSGMGLPNIDKNSDKLEIKSKVGVGTKLKLNFYVE